MLYALLIGGQDARAETPCHAQIRQDTSLSEAIRERSDWQCAHEIDDLSGKRLALRLMPNARAAGEQFAFEAPIGRFDSLTIGLKMSDGTFTSRQYEPRSLSPTKINHSFSVDLPNRHDVAVVYAVFDGLEDAQTAQRAMLQYLPPEKREDGLEAAVLISLLCGFLILPVFVNLAFYRVFKQHFLAWHSVLAMSFAVHIGCSGPLQTLFDVDVESLFIITETSFAMIVVSAIMFLLTIIEPNKLGMALRRALHFSVFWSFGVLSYRLGFPDFFRTNATEIHFAAYVPVILVFALGILTALRAGSRIAKFLAIAWSPFIALAALRIGTMLGIGGSYIDALWLLRTGAAFEVVVTAWAVADRFLAVRRERDNALAEAELLEMVSRRDPLTGALNRRALEPEFGRLIAEDYTTWALLDLDRFKSVNDEYGHMVGDEVLKATVEALDDPEGLTVRVGGEEFLVMLKGKDRQVRAERLRRRVTRVILDRVEGLDSPVTASMGLLDFSGIGADGLDFATLYSRADNLLYQAKESGRNRIVFEYLEMSESSDDASQREATKELFSVPDLGRDRMA